MIAAAGGAIVVTSSIGGLVGAARNSDYAASKWALAGLVKSAALDYAPHNIRINAIAPGPTRSEMFDRWMNTEQLRAMMAAHAPLNAAAGQDRAVTAPSRARIMTRNSALVSSRRWPGDLVEQHAVEERGEVARPAGRLADVGGRELVRDQGADPGARGDQRRAQLRPAGGFQGQLEPGQLALAPRGEPALHDVGGRAGQGIEVVVRQRRDLSNVQVGQPLDGRLQQGLPRPEVIRRGPFGQPGGPVDGAMRQVAHPLPGQRRDRRIGQLGSAGQYLLLMMSLLV